MGANILNNTLNGATVLITGGAGFIGAHLATSLARDAPAAHVVAMDNLRRRGSELHVPRLNEGGVRFVHGDIRNPDDLAVAARDVNVVIECSAEPSVLAGYHDSPHHVIQTNLVGAVNCLEVARRTGAAIIFLSTSRVYPIAALNQILTTEHDTRFGIAPLQTLPGVSAAGVNEQFPLTGARSLYGATKLASELLLQEYGSMYGLRYLINRLGVIAGPGQMGKEEQGVFALWMARHYFGGELTYRGWGGTGKQVRDLLHVDDLWQLVRRQLERWDLVNGRIYNVGGGRHTSLSLRETTDLCQEISGRHIEIHSDPITHPSDVRLYSTDNAAITRDTGWVPTRDARAIFTDIHRWLSANQEHLAPVFASR